MKSSLNKCTIALLGLALSCPWPAVVSTQAQSLKEWRAQQQATKPPKLAPDLDLLLAADDEENRQALRGRTLAQIRQERRSSTLRRVQEPGEPDIARNRVNGVLLPSADVLADEKQSFIVQLDRATPEVVMREKLARFGGRIHQKLDGLGLMVIEAPRTAIRQIAADSNIAYVSPDREVTSSGHVNLTTGFVNPGISDAGDTNPSTWLMGTGMRVAVLDSGIQSNHRLMTNGATWTKVYYQKDFTGQNINGDPYGHGTHVATLLGGSWVSTMYDYEGGAPGAEQLSLRVLDDYGKGAVSNVIAALDWCVANKATYNIRVINMSLGTPARDSYQTDPLCLAARRAWNAGIVVVASAGNAGKDLFGNKLYGGISSPGIEPSIITVGAANTYGTAHRSDDTVATFSSRGPTRGFTTQANGVKKYDNFIKPDLVAPGNKLIGARSYYNGQDNLLARLFPTLRTGSNSGTNDRLMYLSGTSMAAPVVAGTVAVLLQQNPNLTPNLVKAILMYTAQPLKNFNTLEQGAGLLNVDGAVRLTRLIKTTLPTTNGGALLSAALPKAQTSVISGQTVAWGKGIITNYGFLNGNELMTKWQAMYANGRALIEGTPFANGVLTKSSTLTTAGVTLYNGAITNNGVVLGDGTLFASGVVLGDGAALGQGVILGDGVVLGDGVILGDAYASFSPTGDNTAGMPPAP